MYMYMYNVYIYLSIYLFIRLYIKLGKKKLAKKYIWKQNMKSFSNEALNLFFRKFWRFYVLDPAKTVLALRILSEKSIRNFEIKKALRAGEPCTCEYITFPQSFHKGS